MKKLTYNEFGVRSEISRYKKLGLKLQGMREGKPFVHGDEIRINHEGSLYLVEEIHFYNKIGKPIERENVYLDTENRIAGIIINSREEILLLQRIFPDKEYYVFPGGHRRENETVIECLKREMIEETGINIDGFDTELLLETQADGFGQEHFFIINVGDQEIVFQDEDLSDETSKLQVVKIKEALDYDNVYPKQILTQMK